MANTFELIASSTVGLLGATSIDFTSIPSSYTDLCLKLSLRYDALNVANGFSVKFVGSTANFSNRYLEGNGSATGSGNSSSSSFFGNMNGATSTVNTFGSVDIYIPNYASANYKSASSDAVTENNASLAYADLSANLWSNTTAISSISVLTFSGNFVQYSSAYLYGVKNA
jgi:hypothetical protein